MSDDVGQPAKKRLSRAEGKARTRDLLLEAAASTFADKGFAGASVDEIAEAAGFSIGALYSNFANKEQLFMEVLSTRATSRVAQATRIIEGGDDGLQDPMAALGRLLVDVADKDIDFAPLRAEFWLYAVRNPAVLDTFAARMREPAEALELLVGKKMDHHGNPAEIPAANVAVVVHALFQGLVQQRRIDPASVPDELFGQALGWLFNGVSNADQGESR
jgi:AcrR family transcriptional regulator